MADPRASERSLALLRDSTLLIDVHALTVEAAAEQLVHALVTDGQLPGDRESEALKAVLARERSGTSAIGNGAAIPHARLTALDGPRVCIARLARPLNLDAPDGRPVRFFFLLLTSEDDPELHLELLLAIAQLVADLDFAANARLARNPTELREAVESLRRKLKEARENDLVTGDELDSLQRTGRFGGGLIRDIRRRAPHYLSDFRDAVHPKALAAILFLFFACIAPTVAFGGLMAELTGGQIGAMEMLIATSIGGVIYALCSGQPLTIIGGTGPLLVFISVLYQVAAQMSLPFLPLFAWVGLWTAAIVLLVALLDLSSVIRYFTRFTDETFAFLISVIFITEAIGNLLDLWELDDIDHHTALVSWLLAGGTFIIATQLRELRKSRYLRPKLREFIADFGSVIAIGSMVWVALLMPYADLPALAVPDTVTTTSGRPWLVDLSALPAWARWFALVPALFASILVYLDQHITARLVNRAQNRLKKGPGYHLDLTITATMVAVCSLFGLPWLVAATVRSLNHVVALAETEQGVDPEGNIRETIVFVREQRLTGVGIHLLLGGSVFILPLLRRYGIEIPMSVILGLFLFMGVSSLIGNQFWDRLKLWFMEPGRYPSTHYMRRVNTGKIHLYTGIQLACFVLLWVVRASPIALVFPMMIAALVPVRMAMRRLFNEEELAMLDSEELPDEELLREAGV